MFPITVKGRFGQPRMAMDGVSVVGTCGYLVLNVAAQCPNMNKSSTKKPGKYDMSLIFEIRSIEMWEGTIRYNIICDQFPWATKATIIAIADHSPTDTWHTGPGKAYPLVI